VLQNNQLTDELEYQSKQTEKLLSKNQKLEETVTVLKRDVEIHKKVELELAQRSQKAQNEIAVLSKKVKDCEAAKEEKARALAEAQEALEGLNFTEMDEQIFLTEKKLNQFHKSTQDFQRRREKLERENAQIDWKLKQLHEGEHQITSILLEGLQAMERGALEASEQERFVGVFWPGANLSQM
jgi:chromosome segregation ATPase